MALLSFPQPIVQRVTGLSKGMRTPLRGPRRPFVETARPAPPREGETTRKRKLWLECSPEEDQPGGSQPSALSDGFNNALHHQ